MQRDSEPALASPVEENPYAAPQPLSGAALPVAVSAPGDEMSPELLEELQRVANYRQMHKRLRASGIGSVFFGVIAIWIGVNMLHASSLNAILVAIGVFLLVEGLWLIVSPAPIGVILDGVALILVGTWNIAVQILNTMAGHSNPGFWSIFGLFQIGWGVQALNRYPRFAKMPRQQPSPEIIKRIDKIAKDVGKSKMAKDPEIIELQTVNFMGRQAWKGRLRASFAAFVGPNRNEVIFARPSDVAFAPQGKVRPGKSVTGFLRIADRTFKATLPAEALKRFQAWSQTAIA